MEKTVQQRVSLTPAHEQAVPQLERVHVEGGLDLYKKVQPLHKHPEEGRQMEVAQEHLDVT